MLEIISQNQYGEKREFFSVLRFQPKKTERIIHTISRKGCNTKHRQEFFFRRGRKTTEVHKASTGEYPENGRRMLLRLAEAPEAGAEGARVERSGKSEREGGAAPQRDPVSRI